MPWRGLPGAIGRALFEAQMVVTSEPVRAGERWRIVRGSRHEFRFEYYDTREEAERASRLILDAAAMGAGFVDVKVIVLTAAQIARIDGVVRYREIVARC